MKALLLENPHTDADPYLHAAGLTVARHPGALQGEELIEALDGVTVLGIRSKSAVTDEVLARCPKLRCIGAFCIGTNQIDLAAATRRGVAVFNAPFSNTRSVVELVIAEIIALLRRLTQKDRALHEGRWEKSAAGAHEVRGRTIGIVGYGNIGAQLSVVAEALGMRVLFYDRTEKLALGNARRMRTLTDLLREADIVTLPLRAKADSPSPAALGYCQGTPLRTEIEARAPGRLPEMTALVARAFVDRFGAGAIDTRIQAHVIIVGR